MKNTVIFFLLISLLSSCKDRYEIENIEFSTTMCFGTCPVFEMKIDSNKNAEFHAEMYNFSEIIPDFSNNKDGEGKFRTKISDDKYKKLISTINKLNIEDLEDEYSCNRTDMQTVNLKITYDVSFSQKIELTPLGIKSIDTNKEYIIIESDETAENLYINTQLYIQKKFNSPKKQIKFTIENKNINYTEIIKISDITRNPQLRPGFKKSATIDINLTFRDGMVKYEVTNFNLGLIVLHEKVPFKVSIWNPITNELNLKKEKDNLEGLLNAFIEDYTLFINNQNNDEW